MAGTDVSVKILTRVQLTEYIAEDGCFEIEASVTDPNRDELSRAAMETVARAAYLFMKRGGRAFVKDFDEKKYSVVFYRDREDTRAYDVPLGRAVEDVLSLQSADGLEEVICLNSGETILVGQIVVVGEIDRALSDLPQAVRVSSDRKTAYMAREDLRLRDLRGE